MLLGLYKVISVESGSQAITALMPPFNLQPDLILLDIIMAEERGDQLLPRIRQLYSRCDKPPKIVMASILSHVDRVGRSSSHAPPAVQSCPTRGIIPRTLCFTAS